MKTINNRLVTIFLYINKYFLVKLNSFLKNKLISDPWPKLQCRSCDGSLWVYLLIRYTENNELKSNIRNILIIFDCYNNTSSYWTVCFRQIIRVLEFKISIICVAYVLILTPRYFVRISAICEKLKNYFCNLKYSSSPLDLIRVIDIFAFLHTI